MVSELLHGYPNNAGSVQSLNTLDIMSNLNQQPQRDMLEAWHAYFRQRREQVTTDGAHRPMGFPSFVEVMQSMFKVIKQLKLVVVNSDHASGGRQPDWTPRVVNGRTLPPLDTISIFVGGNILGRGLTVENLTTTWYTRTAAQPGEDTTVPPTVVWLHEALGVCDRSHP